MYTIGYYKPVREAWVHIRTYTLTQSMTDALLLGSIVGNVKRMMEVENRHGFWSMCVESMGIGTVFPFNPFVDACWLPYHFKEYHHEGPTISKPSKRFVPSIEYMESLWKRIVSTLSSSTVVRRWIQKWFLYTRQFIYPFSTPYQSLQSCIRCMEEKFKEEFQSDRPDHPQICASCYVETQAKTNSIQPRLASRQKKLD